MYREEEQQYIKIIKDLIKNLGVEATDNYFQEELKITIKNVAYLREKIKESSGLLLETTNSDEKVHLKYDIQDQENLLKNLLTKLNTLNESYRFYLEYIGREVEL
ncbi:MAG: hypothetical protein JJT76_09510 [Clostridiaceae bacterium]|nr:hypothetical protein [Clostridiaceae bacterium]